MTSVRVSGGADDGALAAAKIRRLDDAPRFAPELEQRIQGTVDTLAHDVQ
jgi:hypothetical protein